MWVVPGEDRVAVALGEADERPLEIRRIAASSAVDGPAQPEPQVRRDLVVARAAGVELAGERPDPLAPSADLEVEVDVLERGIPLERSGLDVGAQRVEAGDEARDFVVGQQPGAARARGRARSSPTGRRRASARSISIERVKSATSGSFASLNRPPQSRIVPPRRRW